MLTRHYVRSLSGNRCHFWPVSVKEVYTYLHSIVFCPLKTLYTSPPDKTLHSSTNSTSYLGSIQSPYTYYAKTIHSHYYHHCSIARHSFIQLSELHEASLKEGKCQKLRKGNGRDSNPGCSHPAQNVSWAKLKKENNLYVLFYISR